MADFVDTLLVDMQAAASGQPRITTQQARAQVAALKVCCFLRSSHTSCFAVCISPAA